MSVIASTPYLLSGHAVLDYILRWIVVVVGTSTVGVILWQAVRYPPRLKRRMFLKVYVVCALGPIVAIFTELGQMGHQVTWRLFLNEWLVVTALAVVIDLRHPLIREREGIMPPDPLWKRHKKEDQS